MSDVVVPAWASFFEPVEWAFFRSLVDEALGRRGVTPEWWEDGTAVAFVHGEHGTVTMGTGNLAQMLHQVPNRDDWRKMVGHHVRVFFGALADAVDNAEAAGSDFSAVKDELKIRLFPEAAATENVPVLSIPVMPGVVAVLVRDLPDSVVTVPVDTARKWGLADRDLFALALHNTLAEEVQQETLTLDDGVKVFAWTGESFFVATRVLALERWLEHPHGAFVVVPNRHLAIFHPIEDANAFQAMYDLWAMAQQPFREGPGSLVPDLYWWTPGRFMKVPMVIDEAAQSCSAEPPVEVVAVLQAVMGPDIEA